MQPRIVYVVAASGFGGVASILGVFSTQAKAWARALKARPDESYGAKRMDVDLWVLASEYSQYIIECVSVEVDDDS